MKPSFKSILAVSVIAMAMSSCSKSVLTKRCELTGEGRIVIVGIVSDRSTNQPLENIQLDFKAMDLDGKEVCTETAYSSDTGAYIIDVENITSVVNCTIKATSDDGSYKDAVKKAQVSWSGAAFNRKDNTYTINDFNFYLQSNDKNKNR